VGEGRVRVPDTPQARIVAATNTMTVEIATARLAPS
jgi:hypothetical protein